MKKFILLTFVLTSFVAAAPSFSADEKGNFIRILAFNSIVTIPNNYVFDLATINAGSSFWGGKEGRIVVGPTGELKPEFWAYINKSKQTQKEICGVTVTRTLEEGIPSTLFHNSENYILFAGTPEAVPENALKSICETKKSTLTN